MRIDKVNEKKLVQIAPVAATTDQSGTIDTQGFHAITIAAMYGAEGITLSATDKLQLKIEHSDASGSGFAAVAASDIVVPANAAAQVQAPDSNGIVLVIDAAAEAPGVYAVGYVGAKRYVKATIDFEGTHGAASPVALLAILEAAEFSPPA